jgi:hypothetical protein
MRGETRQDAGAVPHHLLDSRCSFRAHLKAANTGRTTLGHDVCHRGVAKLFATVAERKARRTAAGRRAAEKNGCRENECAQEKSRECTLAATLASAVCTLRRATATPRTPLPEPAAHVQRALDNDRAGNSVRSCRSPWTARADCAFLVCWSVRFATQRSSDCTSTAYSSFLPSAAISPGVIWSEGSPLVSSPRPFVAAAVSVLHSSPVHSSPVP